ncbi:uncharacterized protein [Haliotis asinina]|uniref:uncharacterized protein n=1 Tax=Haliotis asinina TaxID=109174 RepID=UPI003531F26D
MSAITLLAIASLILNGDKLASGSETVSECFVDGAWKQYRHHERLCCGGELEKKTPGKKCCGATGRFYYDSQSLCCEDTMCDRFDEDGVEYGCCGKTKIPLETTVCCGGKSHRRHPDMGCCGTEYINVTQQMCCENEDVPAVVSKHVRGEHYGCCGHLVVDISLQKCRWNVTGNARNPIAVNKQDEFCDGKIISLREKTCCDDKIYDQPYLDPEDQAKRNPQVGCCGTVGYNMNHEVCCSQDHRAEVVIPLDDHLGCCVGSTTGYYNTTTELCCAGNTWPRSSRHDTCCWGQKIDGKSQGCCDGNPYKEDTHFCCEGSPSGVLKKGSTCCGGAKLAPNKICCGNTQVELKEGHDACCFIYYSNQFATYNSTEKVCVEGEVLTKQKGNTRYCGHDQYNDKKAVCCGGEVHHFPPGDTLGCCRWGQKQTVYSEASQMCCQGQVHNTSINEAECCGSSSYPTQSSDNPCHKKCGNSYHNADVTLCCGNKQFSIVDHGDDCCGSSPYFSMEQTCCNGRLYNTTQLRYCCGKELYNPRNQSCCGAYAVVPRQGRRKQRCCRNTMVFTRPKGQCKSNGIVHREKNIHPVENLCQKRTWQDLNGIEVQVCFRRYAIQCTIKRKRTLKLQRELQITMKCRNLKRRYLSEMYHDSFVSQGKDMLKVNIRLPLKKVRCKRKKLENKRVIIFLDKQPTVTVKGQKRHIELRISEKDTFRVVADRKNIREHLQRSSSQKYCNRLFSVLNPEDLY